MMASQAAGHGPVEQHLGRMRVLGVVVGIVVLAVIGLACSQPDAELPPFQIPVEVVPDFVNSADMDQLFPADGGCLLAVGTGVRVLDVLDETGASGVLWPGDILTSVDGVPISSREVLLGVLDDRRAGDEVMVEGTRTGVPFREEIPLSPVPGEAGRAILGIVTETRLNAVPPTNLSEAPIDDVLAKPVILNGWIYRYEPLSAVWTSYPGDPAGRWLGWALTFTQWRIPSPCLWSAWVGADPSP